MDNKRIIRETKKKKKEKKWKSEHEIIIVMNKTSYGRYKVVEGRKKKLIRRRVTHVPVRKIL